MLATLKRWLGTPPDEGRALALEAEAQDLRLRLRECEGKLHVLEHERGSQGERLAASAREGVGRLLEAAAPGVAQLTTQAHLLENEGKPVQARDLLAVARRIVRVLENEGLIVEGAVGATVPFDPDQHAPLGGDLVRGEEVVVRFPAVTLAGRVLHKAGVEKGRG